MFALDPAFAATAHALDDLRLCHVRLQDDARWPWLVLIPRVGGAEELEDLTDDQRTALMAEIVAAGSAVRAAGAAVGTAVEKLNVGQLGNITRQLHVHVVGRRAGDPAWPGPVWGVGVAEAYAPDDLARAVGAARASLGFAAGGRD